MLINNAARALPPTVRESIKSEPSSAASAPSGGFAHAMSEVADIVVNSTVFAFNEAVEIGKDDPALALRYGATTISDKLLEGVGPEIRTTFSDAIIPTIRTSLLAANIYRAKTTFSNPTSNWMEKSMDVARIATDTLGLVGSVLKYAMPAKAGLGETLVGVAYAADTVSHAARLLTHGKDRVKVWKQLAAERKAEKKAENEKNRRSTSDPIIIAPSNSQGLLAK